MSKFNHLSDTIVAISTPMGQGGIGIVRLSGPESITIAQKMFLGKSKQKKNVADFNSHTVHYGWVVSASDDGEEKIIDEALFTIMRAPRSYTCEDIVEINSHGGTVAVKSVLQAALDMGARLAEPGEFTKRAFINGRIDLAQAEAVLDVIRSKTETALRVSSNQLKGRLSEELESLREELMQVYVGG